MTMTFGQQSQPKRYVHLLSQETDTLLSFIIKKQPLVTPTRLSWLIEFGAVYIDSDRILNPVAGVKDGQIIRVHLEPKRYFVDSDLLLKKIVFENRDFLVADKPSGLPMHATLDNFYENLITGLSKATNTQLYITHRLDVPTSGLVVLAKSPKAQTAFNKIISDRSLTKTYEAFVASPITLGLKQHWMRSSPKAPKEIADSPAGDGKWDECLLEIIDCQETDRAILGQTKKVYKLKIKLLTGRTHQIRAQLAFEMNPIIGDEMYGGTPSDWFGLVAKELAFQCPLTLEELNITL
jgi:23S rRNA pseudouridine1911/1915/1917 synthase